MIKQAISILLIISFVFSQTSTFCQEKKQHKINQEKNKTEQEKNKEKLKLKPTLIEQATVPMRTDSTTKFDTNKKRLTGKVGKLKYSDGKITDEFGVKYFLSKKVTVNSARSIYDIDTISDDKLDGIIKQHQKHQNTLYGIGKLTAYGMGLSLALVGAGLGLALSEPDDPNVPNDVEREVNTDVGKDLMKYGGYGFLGSCVFLIPLGLSAKKSSNYLQKELIDRHNNAVKNQNIEANVSMYFGIGAKSLHNLYVPAISLSITF